MEEERTKIRVPNVGEVSAVVTLPSEVEEIEGGVVVAHGQMNDLDHILLKIFSEVLAERGYAALRFNFPYREKGLNVPDKRDILLSAMREAREELSYRIEAPVYLAGKSLGARVASYLAVEEKTPGLIYLGYPIHGPNGEPRDIDHLYKIEAPMLFFVGTNDPFCDIEKLKKILEQREYPSTLQIVEEGDHSFVVPESEERPQHLIYENIAYVAADWLDEYGL